MEESDNLLPKPQTDLPLPEKEISEHATPTPQGDALQNQKPNILRSKFFLGFVAFSILIAFLLGGFVLGKNQLSKSTSPASTPSATPTAKDLNDIKYYSITTPKGWYKAEYKSSTTLSNYDISKANIKDSSPNPKLKIDIFQTTESIQENYDRDVRDSKDGPFNMDSTENITIDNQPALKINYPHMFNIYTKIPSKPIVIGLSFYFNYENNKSISGQILSTFKFTD